MAYAVNGRKKKYKKIKNNNNKKKTYDGEYEKLNIEKVKIKISSFKNTIGMLIKHNLQKYENSKVLAQKRLKFSGIFINYIYFNNVRTF